MIKALSNQSFTYPRHLITTEGMSSKDIDAILSLAAEYFERNHQANKKHDVLRGRTLINLFFENSTRTRTSFELAGKRLGMDVINISTSSSAVKKGESLIDTAKTLNAMQPDYIVVRHSGSGAAEIIASEVNSHVINAGDGSYQHPTQALLDAFSIKQRYGKLKGLTVSICGDIAHSRVARSNIYLLKTMGAKVRLIAPPQLMPSKPEQFGCELFYNMREGLKDADVVMMLRVQNERMNGAALASVREYFHLYGLRRDKLALAKDNALVMHPGPINRGVEIEGDIADDLERSAILNQVESGVAVRQSILELMLKEEK